MIGMLLWYVVPYMHPSLKTKQYIMLGLKYKPGNLWFGYYKPQDDQMEFMKHISCLWKLIELNKNSWSAHSAGKLHKFTSAHRSLGGDKKNCRTLNRYRLSSSSAGHFKWGRLGQSKHPHPARSVPELQHMFWHMFPMDTDAITSPHGLRE